MLIGGKKVKEDLEGAATTIVKQSEKIAELTSEVENVRLAMQKVQKQNEEMQKQQDEILKRFSQALDRTENINAEFQKKIHDLTVFEKDVKHLVTQQIDDTMRKDVLSYFEDIKTGMHVFKDAKKDVDTMVQKTAVVSTEIDKFQAIAKRIKEGDFQLMHIASHMKKMEQEKFRLLKKIDSLEMLCAKIRRRTH